MLKELLVGYAITLGLVVARIGAFVVASPFPGQAMPRTQRVGLVVVLTIAALSTAEPTPRMFDPLTAGPAVVRELALGALIGFAFRAALAGADVAGELASHALGLGSASLFNPALGTQDTALARVFSTFAMLLALAMGAHRVVLQLLLGSFRAVPVGSDVSPSLAAPMMAEIAGGAITLGLRIALPVLAVSLVIQIGLAVVARVAPSLQIFNVGFAVLIGAGFLVILASAREMLQPLGDHLGGLPVRIDRLLGEAAPP
jgi:flagellar biosynthetic protein FliR